MDRGDLQVAERIRLEGYVPFEKIPQYVNSLDVGVSISIREDRQVNSELKVRQYLACGKPVVISPGSNEFVLEENFPGLAVRPKIWELCDKSIYFVARKQ